MLEEKKITDKIEIVNNIIHVREKVIILKDGIEIASSYNRYSLTSVDDRSILDPSVKKIADTLWNE